MCSFVVVAAVLQGGEMDGRSEESEKNGFCAIRGVNAR